MVRPADLEWPDWVRRYRTCWSACPPAHSPSYPAPHRCQSRFSILSKSFLVALLEQRCKRFACRSDCALLLHCLL